MIKYRATNRTNIVITALLMLSGLMTGPLAYGSPFGQGVYGADVGFGSITSLALNVGGDVDIPLSRVGNEFNGNSTNQVTVTSTDVIGYRLYTFSPGSTDMVNGGDAIPASANVTPASLALDTWGYNTDGGTSYVGITNRPVIVRDANGPYKNGDDIDFKYAARLDTTKSSGNYKVNIVYTLVGKNP